MVASARMRPGPPPLPQPPRQPAKTAAAAAVVGSTRKRNRMQKLINVMRPRWFLCAVLIVVALWFLAVCEATDITEGDSGDAAAVQEERQRRTGRILGLGRRIGVSSPQMMNRRAGRPNKFPQRGLGLGAGGDRGRRRQRRPTTRQRMKVHNDNIMQEDSRSERSGEVRVPAPREMLKVKEKVSESGDVEREEAEDDDADAEDTAEMIGDDLVAAWGMKEEPSESETEETSEKPLDDDGDEYDYRDEDDESHDDLEDANLSLERIDEFEEYEDDNLKVEGQVSNRRVDLGMDRVRKPWPTKSRQGSPAADHPHRLHQQQQPQQQPEAQRRTQLHFKKRIIATGPVPRLPAGGGNYPAAGGSKGQYQGHPPRSRKPMPPWARGGPQYKKKWSKKVPPPKGGYGKFGGKPGRRRPHHPQGRPLPTPVPAVPGGVPTARLRITKITTTVTSPTAHEIEEEEMMRLAEMALKVESKRDQIKKFRDQIQSIARDGGGDDEEEQEDDDEEPEGDIVYEVESRSVEEQPPPPPVTYQKVKSDLPPPPPPPQLQKQQQKPKQQQKQQHKHKQQLKQQHQQQKSRQADLLLPQAQPQISPKIIVDEIRPLLQEQKHSIMGDGGLLNRLATKMRKKVKSTLGIGPNARSTPRHPVYHPPRSPSHKKPKFPKKKRPYKTPSKAPTLPADSYLPTDWPVKDSQIAEVAAVHGIGNLSNDYNKLKAELKAKLKAEKKKPHEVINYGVHNEHPSHPYDFTKNPVEDSYDTPKNPVKDSYDTPKNPVNDPFRTPPPPSFGVPGKEPHLFGSPPQFKDSYSKPPPRPQPTYDIPKETYTHPKEEVKHPSYSVPPPPKGGYAALPKPPIGEIIDSYPHSYPHEVHEVPVYSPTGPPMPQMYYDSIPDYRHPEKKKPVIEKPHRANAAGYGDSGPGPTVGFVPTGHGNNFDHAIDVAVNAGEEDKFSFEGFSDSFPFGRRKPHHSPPPPSFKRDLKRPSTQKKRLNGLKSEKNEPVYSGGGKAKFPPAPEFKTPAFKDYETPTGYSVFKQSSFKDDYDGLPFSLDSFKDDYNGPEFRAAGGQFEDYDAADVGDLADFLPPPQSPMVFEKELSSKFPVRDNAPLIKARQPPPPPPPGPPPPPPLPYPKMNKHGALDLAEMDPEKAIKTFHEKGPNFQFPDFGMAEVAEMGDIEKFFNDNFFKKVSSKHDADNMQIKRDFEEDRKEFMHGVPEAAYEPMVMPVDEDDDNNNNNNNNEEQHMNYKANDPFRAANRLKKRPPPPPPTAHQGRPPAQAPPPRPPPPQPHRKILVRPDSLSQGGHFQRHNHHHHQQQHPQHQHQPMRQRSKFPPLPPAPLPMPIGAVPRVTPPPTPQGPQSLALTSSPDFPGETLDLGGLSISDPQGHDDEWPRKTDEGTKQVEQNFKFSKSDRDKEMAFLLKKFYQDNPDPEMVVPSSALLDPWNDSYSGESRKVMEDQEEREPNQLQRRLGVWDPNLEPQHNSEDWQRPEGGHNSESRRNKLRRRTRRRRLKRSPVHYGRGVQRGSHPDHYATRSRQPLSNPTGYSVAPPPVPTSAVPSSRTRMRQQSPAGARHPVSDRRRIDDLSIPRHSPPPSSQFSSKWPPTPSSVAPTSFIPTEYFGSGFEGFGGRVPSRSRSKAPQRSPPPPPSVTVTTPSTVTPFTAFRSRHPRPSSPPSSPSRMRSVHRNHHSSSSSSYSSSSPAGGRKSTSSVSSNSLPFLDSSRVPSRQQEYDSVNDFGYYDKPSSRPRLRTTTESPWTPTKPRPVRRRPTPTPIPTSSGPEDMTFRTSPFQSTRTRSRSPAISASFSTTLAPTNTTPPPSRRAARPSTVPMGAGTSARPPPRTAAVSRHSPRMDEDAFDYYEDYYYDYQSPGTSGKNGVPVMTKPHPTNPDYEYVYYYDYEEEEGEGEGMEKEGGIPDKAVRTTQSSPPATRTSPSSRPPTSTSDPSRTRSPSSSSRRPQSTSKQDAADVPETTGFPHMWDSSGFERTSPRQRTTTEDTDSRSRKPMTRGPTATTVTTGGVGAGRKGSSEYPHSPKAVHPSMSTPTTGSFGSTVADKPVRIKTTAATTANEEQEERNTDTMVPVTTTIPTTTTTTTRRTTTTARSTPAPPPLATANNRMRPQRPPSSVVDRPPCKAEPFCDMRDRNYPLKSVVNIVVLEGPSVQRIYQQVIRDFPGLVGAGWESRRRRTGSCETVEQMVKPGWSKTVEGNWVVVVNTDEYPQEVKAVECKSPGRDCSMMYARTTNSKCEQKTARKRLMVVDPTKPEKGVFTAAFELATECACSVQRAETLLTSGSKNRKAPNRGYYDMAKTIDSSEDEILPPLRTRDPYSTSRARMKPSKQRVKSRNDKKNEPAATEAPSMDVRFRSKSKQQHPAEVVVPLSDRDQDRGRVRLGNHDHHLDRDEVTPPSMPREEDFSRIMRKPSKSKKATASTMMSSEPASSSASPSPPPLMPTPFSRVPIHEQFEKDLDSRFMLSQPTTTTTKSPVDRPIRRVSWGAYGLDGNDDQEYDGGFGNQLIYDDEDDYYREDEQPMATSTERQQQEMTSSTTKRYSPSNTLDDLQKNIESNIGLTTLFNLDGDSPAMPKSSSAMPPSFGPQFPTADPMTVTNEEDEPEVFQSQKSRKSSPAKPSSPSGGPQDVFSSVPTPKMKGSKVKDLSKSKKKTKGKKKSKLNPVAELQLQGALAKLKRGRATLPPKVITPDMYAAPPEEKEAAEKVPFKRIRVMHSTTPRTTPKPGGQERHRERVPPSPVPTPSTTPPPISPMRKASIHMMKDRYKSQLMRAKKVTSAAVEVTNAPPTAPPPAKSWPRFDPTKKPRTYKKASDYMTKFSTKRRSSRTTTRSTTTSTQRTTTTKTVASIDFMEQSPSKISESSFDDFKKVKPKKASIMSTDYDYEDGDYEDDYLYPDRHSPQAVVPVSTTPAPHMKGSPIRMWKVTPKGRHAVNKVEVSTESNSPKSNTAASVSSRRGDFSPTARSRQRQNGGQHDESRTRNMESRNREPEREQESDPEDAIKAYIKSGVHKNDPKKMAEMIRRMKAKSKGPKDMRDDDGAEENTAAKGIFEKYGGGGKKKKGGWRPASKEPQDYDDEVEVEEDEPPTKKTFKLKTWRPDSSYPGGGGDRSGSSDLFRKFASKNAGGSFRRPRPSPNDEQANIAKDIFSKYNGGGGGHDNGGRKKKLPATSYVRTKKKHGSVERTTTESSNAGATPRKPARKYTPRFTTERPNASRADGGGKGGEFWPTPRPFSPKRKMTNRTTMRNPPPPPPWTSSSSEEVTTTSKTTTVRRRMDTTKVVTAPEPSAPAEDVQAKDPEAEGPARGDPESRLDTSSFLLYDDGDTTSANYDYSSFDFERTPVSSGSQSNSPSTFGVDTSAFDYDYEDDYVKELVVQPQTTAQTQHARNKQVEESASDPSSPMVSAKLPIRKVLDIFQELKLNFGRGT